MAIPSKEKGSGNFRSFLFSCLFGGLTTAAIYYFYAFGSPLNIETVTDITTGEFIILTLAAFRLTRLFVYDSVAQFIRDIFLDLKEEKLEGVIMVHRTKPSSGFKRLFADLLSCPWCTGVWVSLATVFIYLAFPITWFLWITLAVAGASSYIQLSINLIGWSAEYKKLSVEKMEN